MTAREDREWKSRNNFGEKRMNMLCECLHQDPAHRVFTFGPSPVTAITSFISSPSIRRSKKIQNHFVCCYLLTIIRSSTYIGSSHGCYIWTQPNGYLHRSRKSESSKEIKSWINGLKKNFFIYQCHHCNFCQ